MAHILIIDDEQPMRHVIASILTKAGHTVSESKDGRDAALQFRETNFDLIITDILMPERDGLETIMNLTRDNVRVPIIAMTGMVSDSAMYLKIAKNLGAWRTISKPFTAEQLLALTNEVLEEAERSD